MTFDTTAIEISEDDAANGRAFAMALPMFLPAFRLNFPQYDPFFDAMEEAGLSEDKIISLIQFLVGGCDIRVTVDGELALRMIVSGDSK